MSNPSDMYLYMYMYITYMYTIIHVQSAAQPNYMKTKYSLNKTKPLPTHSLNYAQLNYGMEEQGVNKDEG